MENHQLFFLNIVLVICLNLQKTKIKPSLPTAPYTGVLLCSQESHQVHLCCKGGHWSPGAKRQQ